MTILGCDDRIVEDTIICPIERVPPCFHGSEDPSVGRTSSVTFAVRSIRNDRKPVCTRSGGTVGATPMPAASESTGSTDGLRPSPQLVHPSSSGKRGARLTDAETRGDTPESARGDETRYVRRRIVRLCGRIFTKRELGSLRDSTVFPKRVTRLDKRVTRLDSASGMCLARQASIYRCRRIPL